MDPKKFNSIAFFTPTILFFLASPVHDLLKSQGVDAYLSLALEFAILGLGFGWFFCALIFRKYIIK